MPVNSLGWSAEEEFNQATDLPVRPHRLRGAQKGRPILLDSCKHYLTSRWFHTPHPQQYWAKGGIWRTKTDEEKSHKAIWWSECHGSVPGINSGRPRDTRDVWADLCGNSHSRGRMSAGQMTGQMEHVQGTDGTQTRVGPAKILYVYWFFRNFLSP